MSRILRGLTVAFGCLAPASALLAEIERFRPADSKAIEVCASPMIPQSGTTRTTTTRSAAAHDGRYVCYTHYAADEQELGEAMLRCIWRTSMPAAT